jgi:hypothetical protein
VYEYVRPISWYTAAFAVPGSEPGIAEKFGLPVGGIADPLPLPLPLLLCAPVASVARAPVALS